MTLVAPETVYRHISHFYLSETPPVNAIFLGHQSYLSCEKVEITIEGTPVGIFAEEM